MTKSKNDMNREIKFRIWANGFMEEVGSITFHTDGSYHVNDEYPVNDVKMQTKYGGDIYYLMQFTGLKDKNGKEIYEGDIVVAWSEGYKHTGEIRWRLEGQPSIIIYPAFANQGFWKIHGSKNSDGTYTDDGVEIIGNIFETPNLLKTE